MTEGTKIVRHHCPAACGWYRDTGHGLDPSQPAWDTTIISHPLYGTITNAAAAARDIASHDCAEYRASAARLRQLLRLSQVAA